MTERLWPLGINHAFPFGYAPQGCARRPTGDWNAWRHPDLSAAATRLLAVVVLGFRIVDCLENAGVDRIVRESLELRLDSVEGAKSGKESATRDGPCVIDRSVGSPLPVAEKRCEGVGEDGSGGTLDECCVAHEGHVGIPVERRYAVRHTERKDVVVRMLHP